MMIKTLVAVAPLFGLLGTVTGMIVVFDVMAFTGGGDAKAMAGGVSQATVPTMSGMVAALSGVFGLTYVERKAEREKHLLGRSSDNGSLIGSEAIEYHHPMRDNYAR